MTDSTGHSTWGVPAPNGARSRGKHAAPATQAPFAQAPATQPPATQAAATQAAFAQALFAQPPATQAAFDQPPAGQTAFAQAPAEHADGADPQAWTPPPTPSAPGVQQKTPEQLAYERGQQDMRRKLTTPRMTPYRVVCGICWAAWTLLFGVSALVSLSQGGIGTFFIAAALAGLAGWYDFRIWTLKARRLTLFIIF